MDAVQPQNQAETLAAQCRAAAKADPQALDRLTDQIHVFDTASILAYGADAAREMSACADTVLADIQKNQAGDPAPLLRALKELMEKFDMGELRTEEKKRRFPFGKPPQKQTQDQILEKYRALSHDLDRVYITMKQYEAQVRAYCRSLQTLCDANVALYKKLVLCIVAGEQGAEEIQRHLQQMEAQLAREPGNTALQMDCDSVRRAKELLERRLHDLRVTETAALQSIPMIWMVQDSQSRLAEKIDAAFLVTLPVFKGALNQALLRKRQSLQAQALKDVDRRARELPPQSPDASPALEQARQTILDAIADLESR